MFTVITLSRFRRSGRRLSLANPGLRREEVAQRARVSPSVAAQYDERVDPWFQRMVKALWQGGYEGAASRIESLPVDSDAVAALSAQIICEAAEIGEAIIVGRGAQCVLRANPQAFHVSIFAPREVRIAALRERLPQGTNAEAKMDETDRHRAGYIRRYFNRDWIDRRLYHLSLCATIGIEKAVETILCASGLASQPRP